jgi:prophage antirepressor-like protein
MENNIQIFKNGQFGEVRVSAIDGKLHFVTKDVARALGYSENTNVATATSFVPNEWKGVFPINTPHGIQEVAFVTEEGLYFWLGRCDKLAALPYQKWIAGEVAPSIRKHGMYATADTVEKMLSDPDVAIKLLQNIKEERQKRLTAEKQIAILKPKAEFMDRVMDCDEKIDVGQAAKILQLPFGRNILFQKLRERGIFFKNRNEPKQDYVERGYFDVKEKWIERDTHDSFMVLKVLVTQKGLSFLSQLFQCSPSQKKMAMLA